MGFGLVDDEFDDVEVNLELDCLEVTAHAGKSFPVADRVSVKLLAGPALAMRQSCRIVARTQEEEETEDCDEDDELRETDLGLGGGVRLQVDLSEEVGLTVGAHYTLGLLNVNEDDDFDLTMKNRALTLRAGLAFLIG